MRQNIANQSETPTFQGRSETLGHLPICYIRGSCLPLWARMQVALMKNFDYVSLRPISVAPSATDRRDFLTQLGVFAGAVGLAGCGDTSNAPLNAQLPVIPPEDVEWSKAACRYCGTGCGVEVAVRDGKAWAIRGDVAGHDRSRFQSGDECCCGFLGGGRLPPRSSRR